MRRLLLLTVFLLTSCSPPLEEPAGIGASAASETAAQSKLAMASSTPAEITPNPTERGTPAELPQDPPKIGTPAAEMPATFTPIPSPSPGQTATPSSTPTIYLTPTLLPGTAPPLPFIPVHFIQNGSRTAPNIALTFDVGQTPENPAGFDHEIVHALVEANAPATFFLGGDWMRTHISETRSLAGEPLFELGNHSWSHPDMRTLAEDQMWDEVLKTQNMMFQITGEQTRLFRLPSGFYNDLALSVIARAGLFTIQWDLVTADPVVDNSAENILGIVQEQVQNGSIIIMHANGRGWNTAEALPEMIRYLRAEGYCLVRISQLINLEPLPTRCQIEDAY